MPDVDQPQTCHEAQKKTHDDEGALIRQKKQTPVGPVNDGAAKSREQDAGQTEAETVEPQVKCRMRKKRSDVMLKSLIN